MPHTRLVDRLVLRPSTYTIPTQGKARLEFPVAGKPVEVWSERTDRRPAGQVDLFILKLPGTGGRAERATIHPAEFWPDRCVEVWSLNSPGYGGSAGRPGLRQMLLAAAQVCQRLLDLAQGRPVLVVGNSLGAAVALHLGANYAIGGLLLRNPPPLRQLIVGEHGWWNLWLPAMLVARQVPVALDSIRNAGCCGWPAVFITSCRDTIVPPKYQDMILRSYAGPMQVIRLEQGSHTSPIPPEQVGPYSGSLQWLLEGAAIAIDSAAVLQRDPFPLSQPDGELDGGPSIAPSWPT